MFQTSAQHAFAMLSTATHPSLTFYTVCISATTLLHAFVTSRIDYCNIVFVGAPKSVTNKLQKVLNAATRVVSGTRKFNSGLTLLVYADLHWLEVSECIKYELCMTMYQCQDSTAPHYLMAPISETTSRHRLRSAASHQLKVPPHRRVTYGGRAFSAASPMTRNSLPKHLHDPSNCTSVLSCLLKTFFFSEDKFMQHIESFGTLQYKCSTNAQPYKTASEKTCNTRITVKVTQGYQQ